MPKVSAVKFEVVNHLVDRLRAGNYTQLGVGSVRRTADQFYGMALEGKLDPSHQSAVMELYKLSLLMKKSTDPRAILAYAGHELEIRDGSVFARAFNSKPLVREEYEIPATPNKEDSIPMMCRDWVIDIRLTREEMPEALRRVAEILVEKEFAGIHLIAPEKIVDGLNVLRLEANSEVIRDLAERIHAERLAFVHYRLYTDLKGTSLFELYSQAEMEKLGFVEKISGNHDYRTLEGDYLPGGDRIAFLNRERALNATKDFSILTDLGTQKSRDHNEDCDGWIKIDANREAYIVVDGMGGEAAGDVASRMVVEKFLSEVKKNGSAIESMKEASAYAAQNGPAGSGATGVAVLVDKEAGKIQVVWVGDSRAKYVSEKEEGLLTRDHSQLIEFARGDLNEVDLSLPLNRDKLQQIEDALDRLNQRHADRGNDFDVRSLGNIVLAAMGAKTKGSKPVIGMIEVPLVMNSSVSKLLLYSDGLIEGAKKGGVEVEDKVTEIARQELSPREMASALRDAAFANETSDNISVIVVRLPGELDLAGLKEISSAQYAKKLIDFMSGENYRLTLGDLRRLVEVYQLNPEMVPRELVEKIKARTEKTSVAEAKELAEKLGIDFAAVEPVEPKVIVDMGANEADPTKPHITQKEIDEAFEGSPSPVPPPLPPELPTLPEEVEEDTTTMTQISDSMVIRPGTNRKYVTVQYKGKPHDAVIIFDGNWGGYHEPLMQGIAQTVISTKGKDKARIYLSHTLMEYLEMLNKEGTPEEKANFFKTLEQAIKARRWWTSKDEIYLNLNPSNLALEVLLAKEIAPKDINVLFAPFANGDSEKK